MAQPAIHVGTAGWSYPDWEGIAYPRANSAERLRTVVEFLDCVEIDSSFYRPPTPRMTANWAKTAAVHTGFQFLAKAWQRFTHERSASWTQAELELFTDGLAPLREAGKLELILFQFPWSFRNERRNQDWLKQIAESFADWPVAVEVRHDSWVSDKVADFFRAHKLTCCNIDQPDLAHCIRPAEIVTSDTGYYRLHGRNGKNWFRERQESYGGRYDYLYAETELDELLHHIRHVAEHTKKTFVIFNNHKDAKAFANALQLKIRLQPDAVVRAPVSLLAAYPALRSRVQPAGEEQLPLM
ncbi:MAG TPA: DUF72 domain-containing protein [Verrucomicrobiae bacterium]|nr:DUF72 domain-containing protein [Verrucomicrobiae bacterium]